MSFVLTIPVTKHVTKQVSKLLGVITRWVKIVKETDSEGNPVYLTEVVTTVTKPVGIFRRKAFVSDINELYGVVKKVMV